MDIVSKIKELKNSKNAIILVHNYQRPEIYEVADFIGDSLGLCISAQNTKADLIVFCGVNFMAESAVILNPGKKVVVPNIDAGCAMADMVDARKLREFKKKYPDAAVVSYINSSAEVKAESDAICTSSNAVKVVSSMPNKKIIFLPDNNLANYVASQVNDKEILPWDGYCPAHNFVTREYLEYAMKEHPKAKIIAHPESKKEVLEISDYVSSTTGMLDCARYDDSEEFVVLTECGMTERLYRELPNKKFYGLCNFCFDMRKNTLISVLKSLEEEKPVIKVDDKIARRAKIAFDRMFAVK